jgi:CRISPR-associated protein Cas1
MRHLLNTLFVTTQGAYLAREGETVQVRVEHETRLQVPVHTLGGIVCFGQVSVSPPLMELCAERNVLISFLSEHGKFLARVQGPVSGNVLLRTLSRRRCRSTRCAASKERRQGRISGCSTI